MNRITYRIPTKDQYAFIEMIVDSDELASPEAIVEQYEKLTKAARGGPGMDPKLFREILDTWLGPEPLHPLQYDPGIFETLNPEQRAIMNAIKLSKARTK
jgi:hypothetical protein